MPKTNRRRTQKKSKRGGAPAHWGNRRVGFFDWRHDKAWEDNYRALSNSLSSSSTSSREEPIEVKEDNRPKFSAYFIESDNDTENIYPEMDLGFLPIIDYDQETLDPTPAGLNKAARIIASRLVYDDFKTIKHGNRYYRFIKKPWAQYFEFTNTKYKKYLQSDRYKGGWRVLYYVDGVYKVGARTPINTPSSMTLRNRTLRQQTPNP
jgi:hypothetical protein